MRGEKNNVHEERLKVKGEIRGPETEAPGPAVPLLGPGLVTLVSLDEST